MHGTHTLSVLPRFLVTCGDSEICIGIYAPCQVTVPWSPPVSIVVETDSFPANRAKLSIETESSQEFTLKLRVPPWAAPGRLTMDGKPTQGSLRDGFLAIPRVWEGKTVVEMELASGLWIENGEIAYPVAEITISGNFGEILKNIEMVGSDLEFRGSICGPTIKVAEMTVAGT